MLGDFFLRFYVQLISSYLTGQAEATESFVRQDEKDLLD
jgi:hypothetical protein